MGGGGFAAGGVFAAAGNIDGGGVMDGMNGIGAPAKSIRNGLAMWKVYRAVPSTAITSD